ncbi:flagellar hook-basal body complex protein FliE [Fluviicoccus keumensis]|uniref:Flagellar hook-basal body complex protein FliE n=1 Tax=Fluviicoccus keumensis TaxID=1435465 RepID=A0A4Q7YNQ7_9GAMM|nr:flagellar hook-basal body complex protein FliE [Fluviicoccus keumensis]RZU38503.1 flagellar hook-basal body complex protein FliE [Fluviicoccus keumensis]
MPVMPVLPEAPGISAMDNAPRSVPGFGQLLMSGLHEVDASSRAATSAMTAFAAGEQISPHELVIGMEQARLSMQLAVEVRNRMVEAYQELTRMQI